MVHSRYFRRFALCAVAISSALAFAVTWLIQPFKYHLARLPMPRLPTLASVADLIAPARMEAIASRFEVQYLKRAAPRGC